MKPTYPKTAFNIHFCKESSCNGHNDCDKCPKAQIHPQLKEVAEWKDKQFEKVIEYAEICYGVFCFNEREKFIENIKKLYRGEKL